MARAGVPKTPEHRAKLAAANIGKRHSDETKAKMRAAKLGKPKSMETRARMSAARLGMQFSAETRARMSASAKSRLQREGELERLKAIGALASGFTGKHTPASKAKMSAKRMGVPCPHARRVEYKGISFRSSWEVRVAKALDALGVPWEYEPKRFYFDKWTYLPDFYLPQDNAYWEVKGFYRWIDQEKVQVFRDQHPDIPLVVFTEPCIQMLEARVAPLTH